MRVSSELELHVTEQPCPLCDERSFKKLASHDRHLLGLITVGCERCGLIQTNPRPDAQGLADFYANHYRKLYQGVTDPSQKYITQYRKDERLRYTARHLLSILDVDERSTVLDYGCGEGSLFIALRAAGFGGRLLGVEPNKNFARYAAEAGQAEVVSTLDLVERVDAVLLNHVLEHLADPVGVLADLGRHMSPDGRLYVDVPNADAYDHVGDLHLAHVFHFTRRTLQALVARAGFEVIHAPGHQRGEVIFWRESDRVAICGDVVRNMSYLTTLPGVREPPPYFTLDVAENRRSIRKLADLEPAITLPGHGEPIRGHDEIERLAQSVGA